MNEQPEVVVILVERRRNTLVFREPGVPGKLEVYNASNKLALKTLHEIGNDKETLLRLRNALHAQAGMEEPHPELEHRIVIQDITDHIGDDPELLEMIIAIREELKRGSTDSGLFPD